MPHRPIRARSLPRTQENPRFSFLNLGSVLDLGGQGRDRTGDLPLFRRTLVPTELPGRTAPEPNAYRTKFLSHCIVLSRLTENNALRP